MRRQGAKALLYKITYPIVSIGPTWYDFYYKFINKNQQGSIVNTSIKENIDDKKKPHLIIFSFRYWLIHSALEMAFAKEKELDGWRVTIIGCDEAISTCDNDMFTDKPIKKTFTHRCEYCSYLLKKLCKRTGANYLSINKYLKNLENLAIPSEKDYSKIVNVSWIRLLRNIYPKTKQERELKEKLIESAKTIDLFFHNYFENVKVDKVIMLNGKFFSENLLRYYCDINSIEYISYERGVLKNTVMFSMNGPAIPAKVKDKWESIKNKKLEIDEDNRLVNYLNNRKNLGNAEYIPFYNKLIDNKNNIIENLNLNMEKESFVLFTNSIWDSSVVDEDTIFTNMFDWVSTTIDYFIKNYEKNLIIRIHPVEVKVSPQQITRSRVDGYIKEKYSDLPDNIKVIPPECEVSPYTLMNICQTGLVYTSTTGLEMSITGKPVIVASNAYYGIEDFIYLPQSKKEYIALLEKGLKPKLNQVLYAKKFANYYYFNHMISYSKWIEQIGSDYRFITPINDVKILKSAGL